MKTVIVGGGTAGWIAALAIKKLQPHQDIVVIESKEIGIVGAGEGATGVFVDLITSSWFDIGISVDEFIKQTNSTPKMGIKHVNWKGDNTEYFAPLDGSDTCYNTPDTMLCNQLINSPKDFHLASKMGRDYNNNKIINSSFHFDAFKVGECFSKLSINNGVKHIQDTVKHVVVENGEIVSLITKSNNIVEGDFFIDCTGFKRLLLNKLDVKWLSYKNNLPVDSAIAFQLPLKQKIDPVTTATALKNGWEWKIPTQERYGCGYVYSSDFTSEDKAYQEIYQRYGEVDILRKFKFESGRSDVVWKSNCIAFGLSAAFAEPLEATSIHTTIVQIINFVSEHLKNNKQETVDLLSIKRYNDITNKMYDDMKDFLVLHYMGGRTDSEFWKYISDKNTITEKVEYILNMSKHTIPSEISFDSYYGAAGAPLWNWILAGLGYIDSKTAEKTLQRINYKVKKYV